jgi:GNAT superfamily N-acetyltransferase
VKYSFAIEDQAAPEDVAAVQAGLLQYNRPFVSDQGEGPLNVFLRDERGALAGGLLGYVWSGWVHIDILWLSEAARGQDYGSRMLALAEQEAARRGCHHASVDTTSFQALPFYLKHGYTQWGQLDDFPIGHSRHFLKKGLTPAPAADAPEASGEKRS